MTALGERAPREQGLAPRYRWRFVARIRRGYGGRFDSFDILARDSKHRVESPSLTASYFKGFHRRHDANAPNLHPNFDDRVRDQPDAEDRAKILHEQPSYVNAKGATVVVRDDEARTALL
ncbi:MAG: hypothetical protein ACRENE_28550 [Polyangiaceae bacterium]